MPTIFRKLPFACLCALSLLLTSCFHDDDDKYKEWRMQNQQYVVDMQNLRENGEPVYTTIRPDWAPGNFVLMRWHNDRALTEKNLVPLYNSTCRVKYKASTIEEAIDSSYNLTTWGDSLYQCKPSGAIIPGFSLALQNMHIGDSCTVVIPYFMAYDYAMTSKIKKPFTTLIYDIKLVSIPAYEIPN